MPAPGDHSGSHPASHDETTATGSISGAVAEDQGQRTPGVTITTATRIAAAKGDDIWLRALMLAPSASSSMFTTVLGDTDMTLMRSFFVKPQTTVAMSFSNDPQMGLQCDRFSGSVTAKLNTTSFGVHTASLH